MKEQNISLVTAGSGSDVEVLAAVQVDPRFFNRIRTGVAQIDEMFGGVDMPGILPGCIMLSTGTPGAGKSTFWLQFADLLAKSGKSVFYNAGEESRQMVKIRADRLHLTGNFCISAIEEVGELVKYVKDHRVEVVVQDSIQSLHDGELHGSRKLLSVCKKLCRLAQSGVTVSAIGHSVKGGKFAGPQEIIHDVDVHSHLVINLETGNRMMVFEKNRFGPSAIPYEFAMSQAGLDFSPTPIAQTQSLSSTPMVDRKSNRREEVKEKVKELLLAGEKLSGYCFERFQVSCSGGFWRGMLALACKELEAQGHQVKEILLAGRCHSYLADRQK
ncbi:MAG: AAA family ATPase [Acidiferrobacterales bacterium]